MAALQTFDQALADSAAASGKEWSDERLVVAGRLASKLSDEELALLRVIWPDRPLTWQKHCAQVLGWVRRDEAIEILMEMVDRGPQALALDALDALDALEAMLARPLAPLHRVLLETFMNRLRSDGGATE